MTQGIAFFDFDDTLARGDSILPFLLYCIRRGIAPRRQLVKAAGAFLYWKLRPSRLSTRCEVGGDGRYTGQVGENCKGEEKVRRIKQYLKENGFVLDMKCSSAYGDSPSDADMMALVNRAVLVNPKKALLRRRPDGIVVHWT